jgi:2-dehydro-3-deoxy-D-arabinonate dehydratase
LKIYRTTKGVVAEDADRLYFSATVSLDSLIARDEPIGSQEVWGAGVTYYRSRVARMEESKEGGDFYDRVYEAERPELFFKATPNRVVGPNQIHPRRFEVECS